MTWFEVSALHTYIHTCSPLSSMPRALMALLLLLLEPPEDAMVSATAEGLSWDHTTLDEKRTKKQIIAVPLTVQNTQHFGVSLLFSHCTEYYESSAGKLVHFSNPWPLTSWAGNLVQDLSLHRTTEGTCQNHEHKTSNFQLVNLTGVATQAQNPWKKQMTAEPIQHQIKSNRLPMIDTTT